MHKEITHVNSHRAKKIKKQKPYYVQHFYSIAAAKIDQ